MTYASNDMRFSHGRRALRLAARTCRRAGVARRRPRGHARFAEPDELVRGEKYKTEVVPETPADDLYNQGLARLKAKDYPSAAKSFQTLEKQYPYSQWQRKGLLMTTFSQYQAGSYDDAIGSAKRYIGLYPNAPDVDYATYLEAMSYYNQIPGRQPRSGARGEARRICSSRSSINTRNPNMPTTAATSFRSPAISLPARR